MTMLFVEMKKSGCRMLAAGALLCLSLSALQAEKYYKLTEPLIESPDGSKPKSPEPSLPVNPTQYKKFIVVDVSAQQVELYEEGSLVFSSPVSTGQKGHSTPTGTFRVSDKHEKWTSTIYNVPMPNFLRLNGGSVGLHAGYLPGYPASHGCIRMPEKTAKHLFEVVPVGTPVIIQGTAPDKEWIKLQYKVKRSPSSVSYSRDSKGASKASGELWKPPYPIIPVSWNMPAGYNEGDKGDAPKSESKSESKTEAKKKKSSQ